MRCVRSLGLSSLNKRTELFSNWRKQKRIFLFEIISFRFQPRQRHNYCRLSKHHFSIELFHRVHVRLKLTRKSKHKNERMREQTICKWEWIILSDVMLWLEPIYRFCLICFFIFPRFRRSPRSNETPINIEKCLCRFSNLNFFFSLCSLLPRRTFVFARLNFF